jgi:hypothetical protein
MTWSSRRNHLKEAASSEWLFFMASLVVVTALLSAVSPPRADAASFSYAGQITSNNGTNLPIGTIFHGVIELDPMANSDRANPGLIFNSAILSWELRNNSDELVGRATAGTVQVEDDLTIQPVVRGNPNPMPTLGTDFVYLSTFRAVHDPALTVEAIGRTWTLYRMDLQLIDTTGMALQNEGFPKDSLLSQQFSTRRFSLSFSNEIGGITLSGPLLSLTRVPVPEPAGARCLLWQARSRSATAA